MSKTFGLPANRLALDNDDASGDYGDRDVMYAGAAVLPVHNDLTYANWANRHMLWQPLQYVTLRIGSLPVRANIGMLASIVMAGSVIGAEAT